MPIPISRVNTEDTTCGFEKCVYNQNTTCTKKEEMPTCEYKVLEHFALSPEIIQLFMQYAKDNGAFIAPIIP